MSKRRLAIVGFCQPHRDWVPYGDPDLEVWGLNRGYLFMPRADRWFDLHSPWIVGSQQRRPGKHIQWLRDFPGPVYVHKRHEALGENQVEYPLEEVAADIGPMVLRTGPLSAVGCTECSSAAHSSSGPSCECGCHREPGMATALRVWDSSGEPYLTSTISLQLALAIHEARFDEIHLYGVDLNTESEYAWQKPGVEFYIGVAAGRGIKVVIPSVCPLLRGNIYGRGYLSEKAEEFSYEGLEHRAKALQEDHQKAALQLAETQGAMKELHWLAAQRIPGADHQQVEQVVTQGAQKEAAMVGQLEEVKGALEETQRWYRKRIAQLEAQRERAEQEAAGLTGGLRALLGFQQTMPNGLHHEALEERRKRFEGAIQRLSMTQRLLAGALRETGYWLHQTLAGQDPEEAIAQLRALVPAAEPGTEGPVTELDLLQAPEPVPDEYGGVTS